MDSHEMLLGELKEFKRATLKKLDDVEREILALQRFKWRVVGGAFTASAVFSAMFKFFI